MRSLFFLFTLFLALTSQSQIMCHALGGTTLDEVGNSITNTYDKKFAICGNNRVTKLDSNANVVWVKTLSAGIGVILNSIIETIDSGLIVTGYIAVSSTNKNVYVAKLDSGGNVIWSNSIGGTADDVGISIIQTRDSGYAIAGYTKSFGPWAPNPDMYALKLSKTGAVQWSRTFGGSSVDYGYDIIQTLDGGYVMVGTWSTNYEVYAVKLSSTGINIWAVTLGEFSALWDIGCNITQAADSSYTISGITQGYGAGLSDNYYLHISKTGTLLGTTTIGGTLTEGPTIVPFNTPMPHCMIRTSDGGHITATTTSSFGVQGFDIYVVKTDAANAIQWTRTIGGAGTDEAYGIVQMTGGGYAICGRTNTFQVTYDIFFVIIDAAGNSCCATGSGGLVGTGGLNSSNGNLSGGGGTTVLTTTFASATLPVDSRCLTCVPPTVSASCSQNPICYGTSTQLNSTVTGGTAPYSYLWQPGGATTSPATVSPTTTTTYTLVVTDALGCSAGSQTVSVTVNPLPTVTIVATDSICNGQVDSLVASGGVSYVWAPGGQTTASIVISPTVTTTYTVTATGSNGCTRTATHTLVVYNCNWLSSFCFTVSNPNQASGRTVIQSPDGGYVVAGYIYHEFANLEDLYVVKISPNGFIVWMKRYGLNWDDIAYDIKNTSDGGFIITGMSSSSTGLDRILLLKLDGNGNMQWTKSMGYPGMPGHAESVIQTSDGGYAITGATYNGGSFLDDEVFVAKLDASGNLTWHVMIGNFNTHERGHCIIQTSDGGYAVAAESFYPNGLISSGYVIKLSSTGTIQWNTIYTGSWSNRATALAQTPDGGYLVAGEWLTKLSSTGSVQWCKTGVGTRMSPTSDGGFILTGNSGYSPSYRNYITKLDNAYNLQWDVMVLPSSNEDVAEGGIFQTSDGGYIFTGEDIAKILVVKLDAAGNGCCVADSNHVQYTLTPFVTSYVSTSTGVTAITGPGYLGVSGMLTDLCMLTSVADFQSDEYDFSVFPNPSSGEYHVRPFSSSDPYSITVRDLSGKIVYSKNGIQGEMTFDLGESAEGLYLITVEMNGKTSSKRLVLTQ